MLQVVKAAVEVVQLVVVVVMVVLYLTTVKVVNDKVPVGRRNRSGWAAGATGDVAYKRKLRPEPADKQFQSESCRDN
jgi:hypothetical protein